MIEILWSRIAYKTTSGWSQKKCKGIEDMRVSHLVKDAENTIGIYFEEVKDKDVFISEKNEEGYSRMSISISKEKATELLSLLNRLLNKWGMSYDYS